MTQTAFAAKLGIDRSCLSRYESEKLGAPTAVINYCLSSLASVLNGTPPTNPGIEQALELAKRTVASLEEAARTRAAAKGRQTVGRGRRR
jgi:hypothetical protein